MRIVARQIHRVAIVFLCLSLSGCQTSIQSIEHRTLTERRNVRMVERVAEDSRATITPLMEPRFNPLTGILTVKVGKDIAGDMQAYETYDEATLTITQKRNNPVADSLMLPFALAFFPIDRTARTFVLDEVYRGKEQGRDVYVTSDLMDPQGKPVGRRGVTRQPMDGVGVLLSIEDAAPRQKVSASDGEVRFELFSLIDDAALLLNRESLSVRLSADIGGTRLEQSFLIAGADFLAFHRLTAAYATEKARQARFAGQHGDMVKFLRIAAELGTPEAQLSLSDLYRDGLGTPQNHQTARQWTERSARQGHAPAQLALAEELRSSDAANAYIWASLAAAQLSDEPRRRAVNLRDQLAGRLGSDGLRAAQSHAGSFVAKAEMRDQIQIATATQTQQPPPLDALRVKGNRNPNAVALVIGIEDYLSLPMARYAGRDARAFGEFAVQALGLEAARVKVLTGADARMLDIEKALDRWLKAEIQSGATDVYVFFAGHGLASPDGRDLYLLPHDGDRAILKRSALDRDQLINTLLAHGAAHVTLFLDTCYSGGSRSGATLLADARPLMIVPRDQGLPPTANLLAASGNDQLSTAFDAARHGLYSYYLMRGLMGEADSNHDRTITLGELSDFVLLHTRREAARLGRDQSPVLVGDGAKVVMRW